MLLFLLVHSMQLLVRLLFREEMIILTSSRLSSLPVGTHFLRLIEHYLTGAQIVTVLAMQGTVF